MSSNLAPKPEDSFKTMEGEAQHQLIFREAAKRGITVTDLSLETGQRTHLLQTDDKAELIVQGIPASRVSMQSRYLCDKKHLSKMVFDQLNIPNAHGILFEDPRDPSILAFMKDGQAYVCKPQVGGNGIGVKMDIFSPQDVAGYFEEHKNLDKQFILEEHLQGEDIRMQVIGSKIVAACIREPAFVIGDGTASLQRLIDRRRKLMLTQNPANRLELDDVAMSLISKQNLSLDAVPESGKRVVLKDVSNMGQGGIATDITDELHPRYHDWVKDIAVLLQSSYFALDLMGSHSSKDPQEHAVALELNAQAEWMHHTFSEGRTHDLASLIIDDLFGEE